MSARSLATKATKLTDAAEATEATDPPRMSKQTKPTTRAAKLVDDGFTTTSSTSSTSTIGFTKPMVNPTSSNLKIDPHGLHGLHSGGLSETGPGKPGKLMGDDDADAAASFGFNNLSDPTEATGFGWGFFGVVDVGGLQAFSGSKASIYVIIYVTFGRRDGDLHLYFIYMYMFFQAFLVMKLCHVHTWKNKKTSKGTSPKQTNIKQLLNFMDTIWTRCGFWL